MNAIGMIEFMRNKIVQGKNHKIYRKEDRDMLWIHSGCENSIKKVFHSMKHKKGNLIFNNILKKKEQTYCTNKTNPKQTITKPNKENQLV